MGFRIQGTGWSWGARRVSIIILQLYRGSVGVSMWSGPKIDRRRNTAVKHGILRKHDYALPNIATRGGSH